MSAPLQYRPEVDGLRALAVLSVVLFHAELALPGGFVGVDVFFVISGYLITSILLREIADGSFSFAAFWERRARRILPASALTVVATLIAGWFLLLPADFHSLSSSALWQSVFGANVYFWRTTNYFAIEDTPPALLHTWSLAIEEQYYFLFPAVLLVACRWAMPGRRWALIGFLGLAIAVSLGLSVWFLPRSPAATFYLLPPRAWELLVGSALAAFPTSWQFRNRWCREGIAWSGLALIVGPCLLYSEQTAFPGWNAVPPCLGAALFIWATQTPVREPRTPAARVTRAAALLSLPPVLFTGRISYSLYLWHWPLFAFASCFCLGPIPFWLRLVLIGATYILGALSWKIVESPFRKRTLAPTRRSMAYWALALLGIPASLGFAILRNHGIPSRFPDALVALEKSKIVDPEALPALRSTTLADARAGNFPKFGAPGSTSIDLMVWGDSHARSMLPALEVLASENGKLVASAWYSSTPPVLGYTPDPKMFSLREDAVAYNQAVFEFIRDQRIPNVLLAGRWSSYMPGDQPTKFKKPPGFARKFTETVNALQSLPTRVWILSEVPAHQVSVPKALIQREWLGKDIGWTQGDRAGHQRLTAPFANVLSQWSGGEVRVIDLQNDLFDPASGRLLQEINGQSLYSDSNHLTRHAIPAIKHSLAPLFQ